jgi:hypothetical protein
MRHDTQMNLIEASLKLITVYMGGYFFGYFLVRALHWIGLI